MAFAAGAFTAARICVEVLAAEWVPEFAETLGAIQHEAAIRPALSRRIGHVLGMSPLEQMRRINARRIVAFMENVKVVIDRAVRQFKGKSMGKTATLSRSRYDAVIRVIATSLPDPAIIRPGALYERPKHFGEWPIALPLYASRTTGKRAERASPWVSRKL